MKTAQKKQFRIFVDNANAHFLQAIAKQMKENKTLKKSRTQLKNDTIAGTTFLTITCAFENASAAKAVLIDVFIDCFLSTYKYNFLLERIVLPTIKEQEKISLTKALTYFDINIDRQLVYNALKSFEDDLFVESFLKFNLASLEKRWQELTALVDSNSLYFAKTETFFELLKFLIANLQSEGGDVLLTQKNGVLTLSDKNTKCHSFDTREDAMNVVIKLISILPKKIKIEVADEAPSETIGVICNLFESKICF